MASPEQTSSNPNTFRLCSSCKKPIAFEADYYRCSVSTCNRARVAYYFCSVPCWDAHLPEQRHRDAWAEQVKAPTRAAYEAEAAREAASASPEPPQRRVVEGRAVASKPASPEPPQRRIVDSRTETAADKEILVVVSKMKAYIKARSGFNTSDEVMDGLSDRLRRIADRAIENAGADGRRTVMKRDLP
jgi:histone H3/H4